MWGPPGAGIQLIAILVSLEFLQKNLRMGAKGKQWSFNIIFKCQCLFRRKPFMKVLRDPI